MIASISTEIVPDNEEEMQRKPVPLVFETLERKHEWVSVSASQIFSNNQRRFLGGYEFIKRDFIQISRWNELMITWRKYAITTDFDENWTPETWRALWKFDKYDGSGE